MSPTDIPDPIFDQWREQISAGNVQQTLQTIRPFLKGRIRDLHNESILRLRDLARAGVEERKGFVTPADARVESRRIEDRVLQLVDAIEDKVTKSRDAAQPMPTPIARPDVIFTAPAPEEGLEKIIGANNLKNIDWLRIGLERARPVGRITTAFDLGTGFLLPGGMLLTNHHVLPTAGVAGKAFVQFNVEEDAVGNPTVSVRYELDVISEGGFRAEQDLDFCLVRVRDRQPGEEKPSVAEWGVLELETAAIPQVGEHVTIIQHPGGGAKQIALTANQVVNIFEHRLQYATDTMPGSSGAPVFNDAWKVVALHHKGGNIVADATGKKIFANEGILVRDLAARLGLT